MKVLLTVILAFPALGCLGQTTSVATNRADGSVPAQIAKTPPPGVDPNHRRFICGRVMQIVPGGLVVDSGYTSLLNPPHTSWVIPGNVIATRDPNALEASSPDSVCIGLVFITDFPKRLPVHRYDYVVLHGYPAGQYDYTPVPGIHKTVRRFTGGVERAVNLNLEEQEKKKP